MSEITVKLSASVDSVAVGAACDAFVAAIQEAIRVDAELSPKPGNVCLSCGAHRNQDGSMPCHCW